ncbi:hypothetical protein [Halomonas elongata]|uniref:hypothetical protein n=1 Tax=Halomonas elongata TaxID=2746 RepID=UPI0023B0DC2B|nr:hypothetical protein [Halomonas elongata]
MTHRIRKTSRLWRVVFLAGLGMASSAAAEQRGPEVFGGPEVFESPAFARQHVVLTDEALDGIQGRYTPEWQVPRVGQVILWDERPGHDAGDIERSGQARLMDGAGNLQRNHTISQRDNR